jgi:dTDP-glucose 4,6-dehydratase
MKILVTGGCGFIGTNFIYSQISNNHILNIDKLTYAGSLSNLVSLKGHKNYQFLKGDICDASFISKTLIDFNPDIIVHFAAESHVDRSINSPMTFVNTNIVGTATLLNAALNHCKKPNFKFLHVSTDEVFGSLHSNDYFIESSPYKPSSPYSASKASSDHLVRSWFHTYGFPSIITNCSNNYGPFQFPEKLIPLIITNCLDEKSLPIYGDGNNIRDWLFVNDHCEAISMVLNNGTIGETYNIGGNNEIQNIVIVNKICSILDELRPLNKNRPHSSLIKHVNDRPGHDFRYAIDSSKIQKFLNWKPKETFESGINKTINWYLKNEKWWRKINNELSHV